MQGMTDKLAMAVDRLWITQVILDLQLKLMLDLQPKVSKIASPACEPHGTTVATDTHTHIAGLCQHIINGKYMWTSTLNNRRPLGVTHHLHILHAHIPIISGHLWKNSEGLFSAAQTPTIFASSPLQI
jgi:hypothetical protein